MTTLRTKQEGSRHVLVVDDDAAIRVALADALAEMNVEVQVAADASKALAVIGSFAPDLVLSDVRMPGLTGIELLKLLRQRAPATDVVLMTAYDDMAIIVTAMREGAIDFLVKPISLAALANLVHRVFEDRAARRALRPGSNESWPLDALVGRDPRMIQVFKLIGQASAGRANVLIRGESGTGKELIARAIHLNAGHAAEPFVPVNCAALPTGLLESELFGHTRGAFTGAVGARRGRFALAGRGTIFLDEIGDTTLEFQSKLLRVLQEREFYAIGAELAERTEARVVAATHQDLERLVADGRFREDLYYRLRIVEIVLPPLRDRLGDVPLLARHLVTRGAVSTGYAQPMIGDDAMRALIEHSWPGNVRELENCLTRAIVLSAGGMIRPEHLGLVRNAPEDAGNALASLDEIERSHVQRVLAHAEGQKTRAADILGVSRPRLNRLLKRHRIE